MEELLNHTVLVNSYLLHDTSSTHTLTEYIDWKLYSFKYCLIFRTCDLWSLFVFCCLLFVKLKAEKDRKYARRKKYHLENDM